MEDTKEQIKIKNNLDVIVSLGIMGNHNDDIFLYLLVHWIYLLAVNISISVVIILMTMFTTDVLLVSPFLQYFYM